MIKTKHGYLMSQQDYDQLNWWGKLGFWLNTGGASRADLPREEKTE